MSSFVLVEVSDSEFDFEELAQPPSSSSLKQVALSTRLGDLAASATCLSAFRLLEAAGSNPAPLLSHFVVTSTTQLEEDIICKLLDSTFQLVTAFSHDADATTTTMSTEQLQQSTSQQTQSLSLQRILDALTTRSFCGIYLWSDAFLEAFNASLLSQPTTNETDTIAALKLPQPFFDEGATFKTESVAPLYQVLTLKILQVLKDMLAWCNVAKSALRATLWLCEVSRKKKTVLECQEEFLQQTFPQVCLRMTPLGCVTKQFDAFQLVGGTCLNDLSVYACLQAALVHPRLGDNKSLPPFVASPDDGSRMLFLMTIHVNGFNKREAAKLKNAEHFVDDRGNMLIGVLVFIPKMKHWVFLVVDPAEGERYVFDSLESTDSTQAEVDRISDIVAEHYWSANPGKVRSQLWPVSVCIPLFRQDDATSCGVCALLHAILIGKLGFQAFYTLQMDRSFQVRAA
jgi:hypothetical protein